jgi:uncharacterized protein YjbI with pentapeptide repeats
MVCAPYAVAAFFHLTIRHLTAAPSERVMGVFPSALVFWLAWLAALAAGLAVWGRALARGDGWLTGLNVAALAVIVWDGVSRVPSRTAREKSKGRGRLAAGLAVMTLAFFGAGSWLTFEFAEEDLPALPFYHPKPGTIEATGVDFTSIDLSRLRGWLRGANLTRANLSGANLEGADLRGATLIHTNLQGAKLSGAKLCGATLTETDLRGAILVGAELCELQKLSSLKLAGADLSGLNLAEADLSRADLVGATLIGTTLTGANLFDAQLDRANLQGAKLDGAVLFGASLVGADLRDASLVATELQLADLTHAKLRGVKAERCNLTEAKLVRAKLDGPDGKKSASGTVDRPGGNRTDLQFCNFTGANLTQAALHDANFFGARLTGAVFQQTDLTSSTMLAFGLVEDQLEGMCGEKNVHVRLTGKGPIEPGVPVASNRAGDSPSLRGSRIEPGKVSEPTSDSRNHELQLCLPELVAEEAKSLKEAKSDEEKQKKLANLDQQGGGVRPRDLAPAATASPASGTPRLSRVDVLYAKARQGDATKYRDTLRAAGIPTTLASTNFSELRSTTDESKRKGTKVVYREGEKALGQQVQSLINAGNVVYSLSRTSGTVQIWVFPDDLPGG